MPKRESKRRQLEAATEKRSTRKQPKRNRKSKRPRRQDWMDNTGDDRPWQGARKTRPTERIMPKGERERRKQAQTVFQVEAKASRVEPSADQETGARGLVTSVSTGSCSVDVNGRQVRCALRGSLTAEHTGYTNVVAVGDQVLIKESGPSQGVVEAVLPRQSVLARPDVHNHHLLQVMVANVDQLLIVASWRAPHFWPELVDRFLISAERYGLVPAICINKVDLAQEGEGLDSVAATYQRLGYQVFRTSATRGVGIGAVREMLGGRMTAVAGMSGAGKSSLLMAVQPDLDLSVKTVSGHSREGRHTTTQVRMYPLDAGGYVVDTPGLREFGLRGLDPAELASYYPEFVQYAPDCRYPNCIHDQEPGCAVRAAVQHGSITTTRMASYLEILGSLSR